MKPSYAGKRRDGNEPDILSDLFSCGFDSWRLNDPIDVLIWPKAGGEFGLIEIKDPSKPKGDRKLTSQQRDFFDRTQHCKRAKVETFDEALAFAKTLRLGA